MCLGANVSGHSHVCAQSCLGTNVSGHKRCVWAQTCLGLVMYGHNRWAQSYLSTNVSWYKRARAQLCGHSRVGSIMYGYKLGGTCVNRGYMKFLNISLSSCKRCFS